MYSYCGYDPVPDAPYIASYGEETYRYLYGEDDREEEEPFAVYDPN